jgi:copper chaperone CopZ
MPEFDVPDMVCDGCVRAITGAVQAAIPGSVVNVDLAAKRVRVTGTEAAEQAAAAMRDAGFTPTPRARRAALALALALGLVGGPALAQTAPAAPSPPPAAPTQAPAHSPAHSGHGTGQRTSPAGKPTAATREYRKEMQVMHRGMAVIYTNDADRDFVALMIPHHQGAIDMAKTVLKYGKDPELRALAEQIVAAQEKEIAQMREWQEKQPK